MPTDPMMIDPGMSGQTPDIDYQVAYKKLLDHLNNAPTLENYKPSIWRKLGGMALGAAAGYGDTSSNPSDPMRAFHVANGVINAPYNTAKEEWNNKTGILEKTAGLESQRLTAQAMQKYRQQMADAATTRAGSTVDYNTARALHLTNLDDPIQIAERTKAAESNKFHNFQPGAYAGVGTNTDNYSQQGTPTQILQERMREIQIPKTQELIGNRQKANTNLRESLRGSNSIQLLNRKAELEGDKPVLPARQKQIEDLARNRVATSGVYASALAGSGLVTKDTTGKPTINWNLLDQNNPKHRILLDAINLEKKKIGNGKKANLPPTTPEGFTEIPDDEDEEN